MAMKTSENSASSYATDETLLCSATIVGDFVSKLDILQLTVFYCAIDFKLYLRNNYLFS